jgi:acetyl esterase
MTPVLAVSILAALAGASPAAAQSRDCLPLVGSGTQGAALLAGATMNVRVGGSPSAPLAVDVYPHADGATRPLALVLRGGAGTVGQRSSYVGQLVETFGDAGYVVATADYRAGSRDSATEDVTAALRFLTMCHAAKLHVDQYRTVMVAEDSAAPIALAVAARLLELRLGRSAAAPAAPAAVVIAGGRLSDAPAPAVPTLLVHGGADGEVPPAEAQALCLRARVACRVVDVPGASHRAENWWPSQWGYKATVLRELGPHVGSVAAASRPRPGLTGLRKRVIFDAAHGLALDAWIPEGAGPHPAVVLVHGGGWEAGDRVTYIAPMFGLAAARGLAWISIDYRLTPAVTVREQVRDVRTALDWIRAHAVELGVDRQRLVLVGESASGQLVTSPGVRPDSLAGVVSFYGVYDLEAMSGDPANPRSLARRLFAIREWSDAARAAVREFSPLHHASEHGTPLLLIAGTADRLVAQQRAYHASLQKAGARVEAIELEGAPHGMEAWHDQERWRVWEARVGQWISEKVKRQK